MAVTLQDVADRAGVAVGTVFRHINGAQLREKNRQKVERAIKELGFKEQVAAIAVLVPQLTQLFAMTIVTALEQYLARERFNILLCDFGGSGQQLQERLKFFKNRAISGIVILPQVFEYGCLDVLNEYRDEGVPIIQIDEIIPGLDSDVVQVDNAHASFRAGEHLIHAQHSRLAILRGPELSGVAQERVDGCLEAFQTYNLPLEEQVMLNGSFTIEGGYAAIKTLWKSSSRPTGIYSTNYEMTLGAIIALNELQVNIPDDLSFVGFDRFVALDLFKPPLTVIEQPLAEIGTTAGELIVRRIRGDYDDFPQHIRLKTRMLPRESVATRAGNENFQINA